MGHPNTVTSPQPPPAPPAPDLSVNKVLAAAGAAATSAVLGSLFGVAGTVLGAAVGAVASTVAASLYQRSLDRARHSLTTRIAVGGRPEHEPDPGAPDPDAPDPDATVVMAAVQDPRTERISPAVAPRASRRRIIGYVVATVLGFVLALGAVTGIEAIKGSTLTEGQAGTSVGRVITGGDAETSAPTTTPTTTPTPTPDVSNSDGDNDHHRSDDSDDSTSAAPSASATAKPSASSAPSSSAAPGTSTAPTSVVPAGSTEGSNQ